MDSKKILKEIKKQLKEIINIKNDKQIQFKTIQIEDKTLYFVYLRSITNFQGRRYFAKNRPLCMISKIDEEYKLYYLDFDKKDFVYRNLECILKYLKKYIELN